MLSCRTEWRPQERRNSFCTRLFCRTNSTRRTYCGAYRTIVATWKERLLCSSEKQLSRNIYERGVDDKGFGRIRSKGDGVLFGGHTTEDMKNRLGIKSTRPLADFLPTLTIAAKNLATEMTNYNVEQKDLYGEHSITTEHMDNNRSIRQMLGQRGIRPEELPAAEDIKKVERRVASNEKKIEKSSSKLLNLNEDNE